MKNQTLSFSEFKSLTEEQQIRYQLRELKKRPKSYIYYDGGQGRKTAILYKDYARTMLSAQKNLADDEGVSLEKIQKNYDNWYYIEPVSEAIESLESDLSYILKYK